MGTTIGLVAIRPDPKVLMSGSVDDAPAAAELLGALGLEVTQKDPSSPPTDKWDNSEISVTVYSGGFLVDNFNFAGDVMHGRRLTKTLARLYPEARVTAICVVDSTNYASYAQFRGSLRTRLVVNDEGEEFVDEGNRDPDVEPGEFDDPEDYYNPARENAFALIDANFTDGEVDLDMLDPARFHWKPPGIFVDLFAGLLDRFRGST